MTTKKLIIVLIIVLVADAIGRLMLLCNIFIPYRVQINLLLLTEVTVPSYLTPKGFTQPYV